VSRGCRVSERTVKHYVRDVGLRVGSTCRYRLILLCFEAGIADGSQRKPLPRLMPFQCRIAVKILEGLTYLEVAEALNISESVVKNVMHEILDVCGVWSGHELVSRYVA
jgi:DNA-binding NarL/FixJ family response regulator